MATLKCDQPDCNKSYSRPQDLGRHKWFAHGIRGKHAHRNKTHNHKPSKRGRPRRAVTVPEASFTQEDLQFEGYTAFTAGEIYAKIQQRAEAAELPYTTFASRVIEFVRATAHGKKLGHPDRLSILSLKAAP